MSDLIISLTALRDHEADVAQAIRDMDCTTDLIPASMFPDRIRAIPQTGGAELTGWHEIDYPAILGASPTTWMSSAGDVFASSTVSNSGLWHLNRSDNAWDQVWTSGGVYTSFFETSTGVVYIGGASTVAAGILLWDGTQVTKIYNAGNTWTRWFETSAGDVYVSSVGGSQFGIVKLSWSNATQVYSTGYSWVFVCETGAGDVLATSSTSQTLGIIRITPTSVTQIWTTGFMWGTAFKCSNGDVFLSSNGSTALGMLRWDGTAITQVWTGNYLW
jgi:hypothetical protein